MKSSLIYISIFLAGIFTGILLTGNNWLPVGQMTTIALYFLLFAVGINLGSDPQLKEIVGSIRIRILYIPLSTITGTLLGVFVYNLIFSDLSTGEAAAVGLGMGYYSLSSTILAGISGEELGVIALLANISREALTLLLAPLYPSWLGKLAAISSGGATSMDTTLPVIIKTAGNRYILHAMVHGIILTILVPFLVTAAYRYL